MSRIAIFYYHSIAPHKNVKWSRNYLTFNLEYFEDALKHLKRNGYVTLFLDEYFEHRLNSNSKSEKLFCLTLDDGFVDNWIYVYPLLQKYNVKATIFVSPEFVDLRELVRFNLDDHWKNKCSFGELNRWGYLTYEEMRLMEKSGLVDIQSHTLTHNKYPASDKIIAFHHPGSNCLNVIGRKFPERKPYYIEDEAFERLIPYGYPFFEEQSAVIIKKREINQDFIAEVCSELANIDWQNYQYDFQKLSQKIASINKNYKNISSLIASVESDEDYQKRVKFELWQSKQILEQELNKTIKYCCWPHGDYNDFSHQAAIALGYKATHIVLKPKESCPKDRFDRTGSTAVDSNRFLTFLKFLYKLNSYREVIGYRHLRKGYNYLKYGAA